ncbi:adenosine kinase [Quaeritorhiza haematococci]|nr:adenosine kinase [Quaeritorhiza haematococci]
MASAHKEYSFLGIENPLLDIMAFVKPELLEKYGLKANDAILAEEKHKPLYAELEKDYKLEYVAGGATQNTMRGAQWLLPPKSTVYLGCVGKDKEADLLREAAAKDGLRTEYRVDEKLPTGRCGVLITGTSRSLVTDLLAANAYTIEHLKKPEIWALVENADYYYVGGYFLTVSPDSAVAIAKHAAEKNKRFTMNLSAPFIPQFFGKQVDELTPYADIIFGNETEAAAFAEAHNFGTTDLHEIALKMAALPKVNTSRPRVVVITHGAEPTVVASEGKVTTFNIIPVAKEEIVDTNGAGDAFCGGFMSQYVQGKPIEVAISAGHYVASIVIRRSGPTYPREPATWKYE